MATFKSSCTALLLVFFAHLNGEAQTMDSAYQAMVKKNYASAFQQYQQLAEAGNAEAQNKVGHFYEYGWGGISKDPQAALYWLTKAANAGNIDAKDTLALKYEGGKGVKKDPKLAIKFLTEVAESGNAFAQGRLGGIYAVGELVPRNATKARYWLERGAAQGDFGSRLLLQSLNRQEAEIYRSPLPQPRFTDCTTFGNMINCVSN
jgi:TPR repeat protein